MPCLFEASFKTGRIHPQSTMKRLNVNILISFLNGYSHWSLSKKFGSYVLKFNAGIGLKHRITKFNPRKWNDKKCIKKKIAPASIDKGGANVSPSKKKKGNEKKKIEKHVQNGSRLYHHQQTKKHPKVRQRINSGEGSSEADSLSWDDYDVAAHKRRQGIHTLENVESLISTYSSPSLSSSSASSKESTPEMHQEGKLLLQEMKELRKEIKKMGDTSVLENNTHSKVIQLLPTDYSIEELQEMMNKMEEEDRCWDSGYNDKEFSSDKEEDMRFKEISSEREYSESIVPEDFDEKLQESDDEEVPFDLEEVHSSHEEEDEVSISESLGSSIVVELSTSSKNMAQYIGATTGARTQISKNQKKKQKRQRAKLRHKNVTRYTAPIAPSGSRNKRSAWSPYHTTRWANYCANTPTPDKEIVAGMDSILGRETINKNLTPTPIMKGRTVIYKNLFAWEVSFCDTKERYKELLQKKFVQDQLKLQSILDNSFHSENTMAIGRSITVS
ncbi:uncharacterized protein [Lepeophtheirus salmonis]|uniref:uncharacterized protein isoform X1 n=2 Tax=Lepeophtheirus salmonis TaxID=72036 RepID=UPI001AE5CDF5|nr:uncharacterized protein LOC121116375 isoform X1 [Lepeophtheirus salmonis]